MAVRRAARPAGEGIYGIIRHDDHTHLAYLLELPSRTGPVEAETSYLVTVRNPRLAPPASRGWEGEGRTDLPPGLWDRLGDQAFAPLDPAELLDDEGVEVLLVAAGDEVWPELGIRIDLGKERAETADIFRDLRLEHSMHPTGPLLKGEWQ